MHNHVFSCQHLSETKIIMFSYLPKSHHDHATLNHCDIINNGLFHALITSYIQAKIYRFMHSPIKAIPTFKHPILIILLGKSN